MTTPWLDRLNDAQRKAVTLGDGPALVIAGAGTGKTRTLASRVAHLIHRGVQPDRILLLTFTRRAAAEMVRRAGQLIGRDVAGAVWGGTFHAVANRLLRIHGRAINLPETFTIMDQSDAADLIHLIRNELGVARAHRRFPRKETLLSIYSRTVNAQQPLEQNLQRHFPWCLEDIEGIRAIFDGYVERKQRQVLLDYDDLLLFWDALCQNSGTATRLADRFDHILVDEYQDTNSVQAQILRGMCRTKTSIMVVGDDAQAIYSFRSATIQNIFDFPDDFPGTEVVTLECNYRSTVPILAAANAIMDQAKKRYTKELWSDRQSGQRPTLLTCEDEAQQCDAVCRKIITHLEQGIPLMEQAVLFRASHHSAQLEVDLARRNIPFHKFGGLKFVEAAHIKDMLAILRILENPYDEISWFRACQLLTGVGPKTAARVMDQLGVRRGGPATGLDQGSRANPLALLLSDPPDVPPAAREQFAELCATLRHCMGSNTARHDEADGTEPRGAHDAPSLSTQIERITQFYEPIFEERYDNAHIRVRDLEQLAKIAARYRSRQRFITDLALDPPRSTSDLAQPPFLEEDYLTLSTIHSAKGCEWKVVHIIHAADGMIPSDMAVVDDDGVEEERRLFYVAVTRAKDWLYVYWPLRYYHVGARKSDAHGYAQLTRFLPKSVCKLFEQQTVGQTVSDEPSEPSTAPTNPYSTIKKLWQTPDSRR